MPKKSPKTARSSRAANARKQQSSVVVSVPRRTLQASSLPVRQMFNLRYAQNFTIDATTGAYGVYTFRANDLYDPDYTGTGHQPLGFDQIIQWYNHFEVVSSHIRVTAATPTLTGTNMAAWGVGIFGGATDAATILTNGSTPLAGMVESGRSSDFKFIGSTTTLGAGMSQQRNSCDFDIKSFFGVKNDQRSADFIGTGASSPAEQAYYSIWYTPWSSSVDPDSITLLAEIEYVAFFSEPKPLVPS